METGTFSPSRRGRCGRKRKTTTREDRILLKHSITDPRKTSDQLRNDLAGYGVNVCSSTVRRRLLAVGRPAHKPYKKQLLTTAMKRKRLLWAKQHRHWTKEQWGKVMYSDESHFEVQGQRSQYVRRSVGEPIRQQHIDQRVKHPQKKMFWGCFTVHGPGTLQPVTGMMNGDAYVEVLRRKMIPAMEKHFPAGDGIFQHDLAPCHTSRKVKQFLQENNINMLSWPGNSPDVNPIENLWGIVKTRLRKYDCTTQVKLMEAVVQIWFHDQELRDMCSKLVQSMPNRVKRVIAVRGGHIKY